MERAAAPLLSSGPPAEGGPPAPMEQSLSKRPRPPSEAEQVSATRVAPHGPWPRPHHIQQPCWPPTWGAADCRSQSSSTRQGPAALLWACLMAEAPPTLARAAPPRRRDPRPGGPYGHNTMTGSLTLESTIHLRPHNAGAPATTPKLRHPTELEPLSSHSCILTTTQ